MTLEDVEQAITSFDLPEKNNPEFTGVLKINNKNVESEIDSKLNATNPTINTTSDDLIMFTGANDTSLKQRLKGKLNATALDSTVVTTNTLSDPVIVGTINYKETSSDTDSRNLISEISNKANLNAPKFSTSLQLNSTNVLLQPGDFNGTLQAYIELKAPATDLSGYLLTTDINEKISKFTLRENFVSTNNAFMNSVTTIANAVSTKAEVDQLTTLIEKPGDYSDNNLESYIQLKAPQPDLPGLVSKPGDYSDNNLDSYIQLQAPEPDQSGYLLTSDINEKLSKYTLRENFVSTNNAFINSVTTIDNAVSTKAEVDQLTTLIDKPGDYSDNNLESYIQLKAAATDLSGYLLTTDINEKLSKFTLREDFISTNNTFINSLTTIANAVSTTAEVDQLTTLIEKPGDYSDNHLESDIQLLIL